MHSNTSKINSISQDSYNYHESVKTYKVKLNQSDQLKSRHQPEGWQRKEAKSIILREDYQQQRQQLQHEQRAMMQSRH